MRKRSGQIPSRRHHDAELCQDVHVVRDALIGP